MGGGAAQETGTEPRGASASAAAPTASSSSFSPTAPSAEAPTPASQAWDRVKSQDNRDRTSRFFKAYGKTWVAMSPIYILGEAIKGDKPGTKLRNEWKGLVSAAEELREVVTTSSADIMIVIDERIRTASEETSKTAAVIKEAGEHAVVVVSTSLEKSREQIHKSSPKIKQAVLKNGKDCVIVVDKALKHPLVITGVSKLARSQGIPYAEAVLQVASLGLSKILKVLPDDEEIAKMLEEIDASELESSAPQEVQAEAKRIGKEAERPSPTLSPSSPAGAGAKPGRKKDSGCLIS